MCGKAAMSGRYKIMRDYNISHVGKRAPIEDEELVYVPSLVVPAIVMKNNNRILTGMHWGFGDVYNARAETVDTKRFWKESYENRRMIFPLCAFFERRWFRTDEPMAAAGIYRITIDRIHQTRQYEASMLTQRANDFVRPSHPRMPVFISMNDIDAWLSGAKGIEKVTQNLELEHI